MSGHRLSTSAAPQGGKQDNELFGLFYSICELQERLEALAAGIDPGPPAPKHGPCPAEGDGRAQWFVDAKEETLQEMGAQITKLEQPATKLSPVWLKHAMTEAVKQFKTFLNEARA
jgi:hypothetical protein